MLESSKELMTVQYVSNIYKFFTAYKLINRFPRLKPGFLLLQLQMELTNRYHSI